MLPKVQVRPKGPPLGFFSALCDFFSKIFEIYQRVPPCIFLKFSVCRKRWISLNGLFLSFSALCDLKNTFFEKNFKNNFFEKKFFPNFSNSCSLNIFEPKIWRRLGTFPSCFLFKTDSKRRTLTFSTLQLKETKRIPPLVFYFLFTFSRKPTKPDVPKGSPLWIFFGTMRLFFENFLMSPKGPPSRFLIFCNGMYVNKSRRSPFYIFRHYATFFERKNFSKISRFFSKKLFCAFWALDMAPTLDVLVLLET